MMTNKHLSTCCRCLKKTDGIHTCTPSAGWRKLEEQRDELLAALEPLRGKFRSGNCIPVERSVITAKEWSRVESAIAAVEQPGAKPSTDADGWIEWKGGECPVSGNTIVQIKMRDGVKDRDLAKSYSWRNFGIDGDIIAYRIVREGGAV